jgi:hypothetical protein
VYRSCVLPPQLELRKQACVSFSVDELSKLEALLAVLALPPDEASELQAGVINRLMDVYHRLTLTAGEVSV